MSHIFNCKLCVGAVAFALLFFTSCSGPDVKLLNVGVYNGLGASATCVLETTEALKIDTEINPVKISPADIMMGRLSDIDVLIFPGGSGSKEYLSMGDKAQKIVDQFIREDGKGVVGICAGAFLSSTTAGYPSLHLSSATVVDRPHYNRGRGLVEVFMNSASEQIFPEIANQSVFLQYYDGPLLSPRGDSMIYSELGTYVTDIRNRSSIPEGLSPGKTFLLHETVGLGQLFLISGHPESTPGLRWMVPRMARFVAGEELVSYKDKWVRPELNDSAIVFLPEVSAYEKSNFWILCDGTKEEKIEAMTHLYELRSRPAVRWNIGLLRDDIPEVRAYAARLLRLTEYTDALSDLQIVYDQETDENVKNQLKETIDFLTDF